MISNEKILEIQDYINQKRFSQRVIAKIVGVSRGTVSNIYTGKKFVIEPEEPEDFEYPKGNYQLCPNCRNMVQMPCLACYLRERNKKVR